MKLLFSFGLFTCFTSISSVPLVPAVDNRVIAISPNGGGTYPRLTKLSDGTILAAFTVIENQTHTITVTRSADGGNSFSALGTVAQSTGDLDNPFITQLNDGSLVCTMRNHDRLANGTYTFYRITACKSTDGGQTWSFLSQVIQRAANAVNNGVWEPFGRIAHSGAFQVYFASENSQTDQDILMSNSTDGGETWSAPITVAGGTTTGRDGMPGCTDFNDGGQKVLCVFETTEGTGTFTIKSVVSTNDGSIWGQRNQVYVPTGTNNNAGAPDVVTTTNGAFIVSFMTDEDTSLHNWTQGADFKIVTSDAVQAATWGHKTTVTGVQSNWPGLLARSDGTVLGCADFSGVTCRSISFS